MKYSHAHMREGRRGETYFCVLVVRVHFDISLFGSAVPKKIGLNWFIPALANNNVGSSNGIVDDECTYK